LDFLQTMWFSSQWAFGRCTIWATRWSRRPKQRL